MKKTLIEELTEILQRPIKEIQGEESAILIWNSALDTAANQFWDNRKYDGYHIHKRLKELKK